MRFKSQLANVAPFAKFTASLASLGKICWVKLEDEVIRFSIVPDQGTQVWAQLPIEALFEPKSYKLESATRIINLEVPIGALNRALNSAIGALSAELRLSKKDSQPVLSLTVVTSSFTSAKNPLKTVDEGEPSSSAGGYPRSTQARHASAAAAVPGVAADEALLQDGPRERATVITQAVPVRILHASEVEGLHEPRCRDPDVQIMLPSLVQLKSISDRFTKLALDTAATARDGGAGTGMGFVGGIGGGPKLELSANMHGSLKLAIATDTLKISSVWTGLSNIPLKPDHMEQNDTNQPPGERMQTIGDEGPDSDEGWARVRIDGKDWGRVLSVGRMSPKVAACMCIRFLISYASTKL
ncbi:hypothetical protein FQN57_002371 [Myotisia sp. PD_48]|nr:hypothetical protein FQN57_002371 [Myotisia sp. PD_48]